jgi:hypothetical protein
LVNILIAISCNDLIYLSVQAKPDYSSSSSGTIVGIVAAVLGVGVIVVIVFFLR